jgi:hypothetical protein
MPTSSIPDAAIRVPLMHLISRSGVVADRAMSDTIGAKRIRVIELRLLELSFKGFGAAFARPKTVQ